MERNTSNRIGKDTNGYNVAMFNTTVASTLYNREWIVWSRSYFLYRVTTAALPNPKLCCSPILAPSTCRFPATPRSFVKKGQRIKNGEHCLPKSILPANSTQHTGQVRLHQLDDLVEIITGGRKERRPSFPPTFRLKSARWIDNPSATKLAQFPA